MAGAAPARRISGSYASPTLARVVGGDLCSGCGLCASLGGGAVDMAMAGPGYLRPVQHAPLAAETERAVAQVCPGSRVAPWPVDADPLWGPLGTVAVGYATDEDLRHRASSGGAISALVAHALTAGMIDGVLQTRADDTDPIGTMSVVSLDQADIADAAGSRYAPSSPLATIAERLAEDGRRYAFVGKPCDVSALRQLGRLDPRAAERFPLMLAFFCAGIPSRTGTHRVLEAMGVEPSRVTAFRYRGNGWPGQATAVTNDGGSASMSYAKSWGRYLANHVQFRCKICPDAVGGVADIACADAWYGGETGYPAFDEAAGRSLIVARTPAGEALLAAAAAAGAVAYEPLDPAEIALMQPAQRRRREMLVARLAALVVAGRPRPDMTGLKLGTAARGASLKLSVQNFLGTARRVMWTRP